MSKNMTFTHVFINFFIRILTQALTLIDLAKNKFFSFIFYLLENEKDRFF